VAIGDGSILASSDSGATWTERIVDGVYWNTVAASANGQTLVAVGNGLVYISTNGGVDWTQSSLPVSDWRQPAVSGDGLTIVVNDMYGGNGIYVTTNGGVSWDVRATKDNQGHSFSAANGITMTADSHVAYVGTAGGYFKSIDLGTIWVKMTIPQALTIGGAAASDDGTTLVMVDGGQGSGGFVYVSNDSGASWTQQTVTAQRAWRSAYVSGDSSLLAVFADTASYLVPVAVASSDAVFHYATLQSSAPLAVSHATLSVAASACSTIATGSASAIGASGVESPDKSISIVGGIAYSLTCSTHGGSANATITLGKHFSDLTTLRVYKKKSGSSALTDITKQVTLANATQGDGSVATVISYALTDGGSFDEDGTANGTIVDPLYIGVSNTAGQLADTGMNISVPLFIATIAILSGALMAYRMLGVSASIKLG
jgi:hypothetical protein